MTKCKCKCLCRVLFVSLASKCFYCSFLFFSVVYDSENNCIVSCHIYMGCIKNRRVQINIPMDASLIVPASSSALHMQHRTWQVWNERFRLCAVLVLSVVSEFIHVTSQEGLREGGHGEREREREREGVGVYTGAWWR